MTLPKDPVKAEQVKKRISESNKGKNLGRVLPPRTEEWKQKQSKVQVGQSRSEETKQKMSASRKGVPKSEETKRKMAEAHRRK